MRKTITEVLRDSRARLVRFEPSSAHRVMSEGRAIVIDTRCAELRRETGIIPGSVHVPLSVLFWRLDPDSGFDDPRLSDPNRRLILVCADGYSSSLAAATLLDIGFVNATDMVGGFEAWAADGLPVEAITG